MSIPLKRICVDMDEVIADTVAEHLVRYNRDYSDNLTKTDLRDNTPGSPSSQTLMTCENCGHLLYYDPARDSPQPAAAESIPAQSLSS